MSALKIAVFALLTVLLSFLTRALDTYETAPPETPPLIRTNNGFISGRVIRAANGKFTREFLNIPYAEAPIGELRFRAPRPIHNWSGGRDGTKLGNACAQTESEQYFAPTIFKWKPDSATFSENCLTINIYTPYDAQRSSALVPVLIWIHGGGFQWGSNNMAIYNASILASEVNAIVAVVNYRLGVFGFLTLDGVDGVKGNQGLLDQALAIKWVSDNIQYFGGDPQQITLAGESAGSASVQYHLLSPLSRSLFARAIMQSGSATSSWAFHVPAKVRQRTRSYMITTGCADNKPDQETFACFRSKSTKQIGDAYEQIRRETGPLKPTIDGVFLSNAPSVYLSTSDFKAEPIMIGTVANENMAYMDSTYFTDIVDAHGGLTKSAYDEALQTITHFTDEVVKNAITFVYRNWSLSMADDDSSIISANERVRMLTAVADDVDMNNGMMELLDAYLKANLSAYRYRLDERASVPLWQHNFSGVAHGDQLPFILGHVLDPKLGYVEKDVVLARRILKTISNFVRTGNPNNSSIDREVSKEDKLHWKPYSGQSEYFAWAANENFGKVRFGPERWRTDFWCRAAPYLATNASEVDINGDPSKGLCTSYTNYMITVSVLSLALFVALFYAIRNTNKYAARS